MQHRPIARLKLISWFFILPTFLSPRTTPIGGTRRSDGIHRCDEVGRHNNEGNGLFCAVAHGRNGSGFQSRQPVASIPTVKAGRSGLPYRRKGTAAGRDFASIASRRCTAGYRRCLAFALQCQCLAYPKNPASYVLCGKVYSDGKRYRQTFVFLDEMEPTPLDAFFP